MKLRQLLCPPSGGVLYCTFGIGKFHAGFDDRFQAESRWNCVNFFAHHQEFSTVHSALVSFMQVSDDRFQAESGWKRE